VAEAVLNLFTPAKVLRRARRTPESLGLAVEQGAAAAAK
jgi:hypothetical protein